MKEQLAYLEKVRTYIESLGYEVNPVDPDFPDLLDVWGRLSPNGTKCFVEIYLSYNNGCGYWTQNGEEAEIHENPDGSLDTRFFSMSILEDMFPLNAISKITSIEGNVISVNFS